jgi:hypothetical protein
VNDPDPPPEPPAPTEPPTPFTWVIVVGLAVWALGAVMIVLTWY